MAGVSEIVRQRGRHVPEGMHQCWLEKKVQAIHARGGAVLMQMAWLPIKDAVEGSVVALRGEGAGWVIKNVYRYGASA